MILGARFNWYGERGGDNDEALTWGKNFINLLFLKNVYRRSLFFFLGLRAGSRPLLALRTHSRAFGDIFEKSEKNRGRKIAQTLLVVIEFEEFWRETVVMWPKSDRTTGSNSLLLPFAQAVSFLGSISTVSRVRSLILPEERRLDAWPVDLVCDVIEKLIIYASPISLEVKPVSNFLIYLAQNYIKRSLTHPNDFRNSFFGTFPYISKKILRYISVHGDM